MGKNADDENEQISINNVVCLEECDNVIVPNVRMIIDDHQSSKKSNDLHLVVIDEKDSDAILVHRISPEDIYSTQKGTIISWKDIKLCTELALSFQEATGCSHIWDKICGVQRTLQFNNLDGHDVTRSSVGTSKAPKTMQSKAAAKPFYVINDELKKLPPVELSNLSLILKVNNSNVFAEKRGRTDGGAYKR